MAKGIRFKILKNIGVIKILKNIGVISESPKGWAKELNIVSWNDGEPKYDIRDWDPDHEKMGKGVTLTKDELIKIKNCLM